LLEFDLQCEKDINIIFLQLIFESLLLLRFFPSEEKRIGPLYRKDIYQRKTGGSIAKELVELLTHEG
jgi:hypothetical protein